MQCLDIILTITFYYMTIVKKREWPATPYSIFVVVGTHQDLIYHIPITTHIHYIKHHNFIS